MKEITDEQLERKVASQNRRSQRQELSRLIYEHLSTKSVLRFRSTVGTMRRASKQMAMQNSQVVRREAATS